MRIIKGFNFHPNKLEWYLKQNELNSFLGNFFIEESDKYWCYTGKGECFYPKTNPKKIFDDAYLMCTQVVNAKHIKLNFGHNYSKVPHQLEIGRMEFFRQEPQFDEIVFSTWLTYLFLYYESHFYPEGEVPFNISYFLKKIMAIDGEVFKDALFDEWKAKTDEFIEKNKALGEPYRYDFTPSQVNPNFVGSEPWEKWTEGFNTDIIEELIEGDTYGMILSIRTAWQKYDKENANMPKEENYADQYFFDKYDPFKNGAYNNHPSDGELKRQADAMSKLDDIGEQVGTTKEEDKPSTSTKKSTTNVTDEDILVDLITHCSSNVKKHTIAALKVISIAYSLNIKDNKILCEKVGTDKGALSKGLGDLSLSEASPVADFKFKAWKNKSHPAYKVIERMSKYIEEKYKKKYFSNEENVFLK